MLERKQPFFMLKLIMKNFETQKNMRFSVVLLYDDNKTTAPQKLSRSKFITP